jgi:predicted aldo/keto reductase-like oxidoreductase
MQYRDFGGVGWRPSALGFGAMRLPTVTAGAPEAGSAGAGAGSAAAITERIDQARATAMLRRAVELGVNYVDTAYGYHDGESEVWLGRALRDVAAALHGDAPDPLAELRRRVRVATKLPVWKCRSAADFDRFFEEQLERLGLPDIDFYLLHSLRDETWGRVRDLGVVEWAERQLSNGRIGHFGFSFHDRYQAFADILAATDIWEFCQIQLNYVDTEYQAGLRGLCDAAERGLGVVVMEPVRGGRLAKAPPRVQEIWETAPVPRSPVEWALQWVWDRPEVSLVLSGMGTLEQVEQNASFAARSRPGLLSDEDLAVVARVRDAYRELLVVNCTDCRYCLPCPSGVGIPAVLEVLNDLYVYDDLEGQRDVYTWLEEEQRADRCTSCRECESRCPQGIPIADWMRKADELFGSRPNEHV